MIKPPTEIHRSESCQAGHGVSGLQLSPVSQQDVEDVVLGAGSQGALVHAATHQLTVVDHHDWECDKNRRHYCIVCHRKEVKGEESTALCSSGDTEGS